MHFVHKEYPRCLHKFGGLTVIVNSAEEVAAKLAEGWSMQPVMDAPVVAPVVADEPTRGWAPPDAPKKRRKPTVN